jgi:oxygen-dependent protoporphyrinogen oxidase
MPDVVIAGGGIAGLSCAWRLHSSGIDVLVLEKEPVAGGNIRTTDEAGYRFERGPHTFMGSAEPVLELTSLAGLDESLVPTRPEASARFVARAGRLHRVPSGLWSFLTTGLLSMSAKLELATEPWRNERGQPDDTAARFFERRFGREAARVIAGAFVSGVYAGDPELLSAAAAFPLFWRFEQESGSMIRGALRHRREQRAARGDSPAQRRGLFSFEDGLGQLTATLAHGLGERCRTGVVVERVTPLPSGFDVVTDQGTLRSRVVVVAAPPRAAGEVLAGADAALPDLLDGIPLAPVAVIHLGFTERCREVPDGFGFLVPRGEDVRTLGVLFPSRLFHGRAPEGGDLLTAFVGGMTDRDALALDDDELVTIVRSDLERLTGFQRAPDLVRVARFREAIPQLVVGHLDRISKIREHLAAIPGLHLAGNYLKGVGMKDAVASGFEAADAVSGSLDAFV